MVYKKKKGKIRKSKLILKSLIVGITVLIIDYLSHTFIANKETFFYFLLKPIISGYVAYLMFKYSSKVKYKLLSYFFYSVVFASIHGLYYRLIELVQGQQLLSRIGDITVFNFIFPADNIPLMLLGWYLIHGGSYLAGVLIVRLIYGKK